MAEFTRRQGEQLTIVQPFVSAAGEPVTPTECPFAGIYYNLLPVSESVAQGIVTYLYDVMFDRTPDDSGLSFWTSEIVAGNRTILRVCADLGGSPEFWEGFSGESVPFFINRLYQRVQRRRPTADEITSGESTLGDGSDQGVRTLYAIEVLFNSPIVPQSNALVERKFLTAINPAAQPNLFRLDLTLGPQYVVGKTYTAFMQAWDDETPFVASRTFSVVPGGSPGGITSIAFWEQSAADFNVWQNTDGVLRAGKNPVVP